MNGTSSALFSRIENEIHTYYSGTVEITPGVKYSQNATIERIYKFRNRDLSGSKINDDLSYNYYFDIISPRCDSVIKNLRFDTKNILIFSQNPIKDFAAVFLSNASLKNWMANGGEDMKLKSVVEEFVTNGNVIFKRVSGGYKTTDPLNTIITNQRAETIDDTDVIEKIDMIASQMRRMSVWDKDVVEQVIKELGNKAFVTAQNITPATSTNKHYEIYEFTGEVSEKEYNAIKGIEDEGNENTHFLAKIIFAGLNQAHSGERYVLFAEKLGEKEKMSDRYLDAHFGRYEGRFWRIGLYELLFDHQIRANQIGNDLAKGLEWAAKVLFKSSDSRVLQNIRADLDNGDVIITNDLEPINTRMNGLDQLVADWNRVMNDADKLANSFEVVRGEALPSGTPFRMGLLMDQNAGKLFVLLRQKIALPYARVFREWVLPELVKNMQATDVFRFTGDTEVLDQLRVILVENWYATNLVAIGPHTKEVGEAIKQEKLDEARRVDPALKNSGEIWKGVQPRLYVTIVGENYSFDEQVQDLIELLKLEQDPERISWMLDQIYRIRNIPIPPKKQQEPPDPLMAVEEEEAGKTPRTQTRQQRQALPQNTMTTPLGG